MTVREDVQAYIQRRRRELAADGRDFPYDPLDRAIAERLDVGEDDDLIPIFLHAAQDPDSRETMNVAFRRAEQSDPGSSS